MIRLFVFLGVYAAFSILTWCRPLWFTGSKITGKDIEEGIISQIRAANDGELDGIDVSRSVLYSRIVSSLLWLPLLIKYTYQILLAKKN